MRKPVLPLNQEEKDWIALGLKNSGMEKVVLPHQSSVRYSATRP